MTERLYNERYTYFINRLQNMLKNYDIAFNMSLVDDNTIKLTYVLNKKNRLFLIPLNSMLSDTYLLDVEKYIKKLIVMLEEDISYCFKK